MWGPLFNTGQTSVLDSALGGLTSFAMTSSDVTLTLSQWQSGTRFKITGLLTGNHILNLPRTDATSPDAGVHAVGGLFTVDNQTTGAFTITVQTTVGGSTGVTVAQGSRTTLYSDGTNVWYADDSRSAKLNTNAGSPQGSVTGSAGAVNAPADVLWDRTNQALYVSLGGTNWVVIGQTLPNPQGYLTPTSGTPIIPADVSGATTIYYTPYRGNQVPIYNGTAFAVYAVPEIAIGIGGATASSIYDLFVAVVGGTVVAGWGPAWSAGSGGSVTPGACARGTGAGGTALQRINGIWTNAASMNLSNVGGAGSPPYAISANQGTYVGSMFVDASTGQVSLLRSYGGGTTAGPGTARKWGLWNAYNRESIGLLCGDTGTFAGSAGPLSTFNFTQTQNGGWAQLNGQGAIKINGATQANGLNPNGNVITAFCGLQEEEIDVAYSQALIGSSNVAIPGIGVNSTSSGSGLNSPGVAGLFSGLGGLFHARSVVAPTLGLTNIFPLIWNFGASGNIITCYTQQNACFLTARYMG